MMFGDRVDAGRRLAAALEGLAPLAPVVLGLSRGGVPVAAEVAASLNAPLDVLVVRKLGCPWSPERGVGALGEEGVRLLNRRAISQLHLQPEELDAVTVREQGELARRVRLYRGDRPPIDLRGRTVVVVDDGVATGFTALAAMEVCRRRGAHRVVLAVPVAPIRALPELTRSADDVVCLRDSYVFSAVGQFYADFHETSDDEVVRILSDRSRVTAPAVDVQRPEGLGRSSVEALPVVPHQTGAR